MRLRPARLFRLVLGASLALSAVLYFVWSWRWPLIGDCSLMHYIGFLIERGWAPYRQLVDMNMPGSYLIEIAAMHLFGPGALAWRLYDFTLLGIAAVAFFVVTLSSEAERPEIRRASWLPGLFAASLFIVIHGRDGIFDGGQRDFTMAVLLLAATAFLFLAVRRGSAWPIAAFGLLSGLALTIKPTILPLTLAQLLLALYVLRRHARLSGQQAGLWRSYAVAAVLGYLVAPLIVLGFLLRRDALGAFFDTLRGLIPYYAGLGHRPLGFLLLHSISPLLPLVLLWFAVLALKRRTPRALRDWTQGRTQDWAHDWTQDWERIALLCGVLFGLGSYLLQARGLPYYRYPLLAFLLPVMALDFDRALGLLLAGPSFRLRGGPHRTRLAAVLALAAVCFGGFFLAPQSAVRLHRYRWQQTDFLSSLEGNLNALGGPALSGHIQCIDTISGCNNALYLMRLEPADGVLSDFPLFGLASVPVVRQIRARLWATLVTDPPRVIVVSSGLYIDGPGDFRKLARWPAFREFLATHYILRTQWSPMRPELWWSREEMPDSYRIYVLRGAPSAATPHP